MTVTRRLLLFSAALAASSASSFQTPVSSVATSTKPKQPVSLHTADTALFMNISSENHHEEDDTTTNMSNSSVLQESPRPQDEIVNIEKQQKRTIVALAGLAALTLVTTSAKLGFLGDSYTDIEIVRDVASTILTAALGFGFVKLCTYLASREILESRDSRKIIHTLSAPLFCVVWPLFSSQPNAKWFAAVVPLVNAMRLYVAGTSGDEQELANAVSRSGNAKEALGGPFIYVIILFSTTILYWHNSLVGLVSLSAMAAGDGMADLVGRRYGAKKWFFSNDKSIVGSLAFWTSSTVCALILIGWMQYTTDMTVNVDNLVLRVGGIMAASAAIELLPWGDDNWTVPISAALLGMIFLN